MTIHTHPAAFDSIKRSLVALKMPRALEMLDATLRRVEQGDMTWVDALDNLLLEELTLRDNRRVSTALRMSRLTTVKTLAGFDFAFRHHQDSGNVDGLLDDDLGGLGHHGREVKCRHPVVGTRQQLTRAGSEAGHDQGAGAHADAADRQEMHGDANDDRRRDVEGVECGEGRLHRRAHR